MYISYYKRDASIKSKIRQLQQVLTYPLSWYEGKADTEIEAIYTANLLKIVDYACKVDEMEVRRRAGLK